MTPKANVLTVVREHVDLVEQDGVWCGHCPFHRPPDPDHAKRTFIVCDQFYHCYLCGRHGDAISFVMQTERLGFPEAVERLAAMERV